MEECQMGKIAGRFQMLRDRGEAALVPYLMAGYPTLEATAELLYAIVDAGADLVELGVPFSDPLADGATLQAASHRALAGGTTLPRVLDLVASVRSNIAIPLVLMSYCNPVLRMGEDFATQAGAAGVDGLIIPDLPLEESDPVHEVCAAAGVDLIGMVAPTSPAERVRQIARSAEGFVYCVSLRGVTGARSVLSDGVRPLVDRVKAETSLPAVVGFGISTPDHVRAVTSFSDGAVVASALLDRINRSPESRVQAAAQFVKELKGACRARAKV
jgi:tryptophan synthase alpha chain